MSRGGLSFGLLLAGLWMVSPPCARGDVFEGDARASTRVSVRSVNAPLTEVLRDVGSQCALSLSADRAATERSVTLLCHNRRAADVLRVVASFLDLSWQRTSSGYRVVEPPEARDRNEAAVRRTTAPLPDMIYAEACAGADYDAGKPDQPAGDRLVKRILRAAGKNAIRRIFESGRAQFAFPARTGCLTIPSEVFDQWRAEPLGTWDRGDDPRKAEWVSLRCDLAFTYLVPSLCYTLRAGTVGTGQAVGTGKPTFFHTGGLPAVDRYVPPLVAEPVRPEGYAPPVWTSEQSAVELPDVFDTSKVNQVVAEMPRTYLLGDALAEMVRVRQVDVVADAFPAPQMIGVHISPRPLAEVLDALAGMTLSRWWTDDGFVCMAHRQRALSRLVCPPSRLIEDVRDRLSSARLSLDDLVALALLPTPQYERIWFPANPPMLPHSLRFVGGQKAALCLWASLSEAQRAEALAGGLPVARFSAGQTDLLWDVLNDVRGSTTYVAPRAMLEDLVSKAVLKATNTTSRVYGSRLRPGFSAPLYDPTTTLRSIQILDANATEGDVRTGNVRGLWIRIMSGSVCLQSATAGLPIDWDE